MRIENLPRLSEEDREALNDGAIEGVPAPWACPHCNGSGIDPSEGYLCEACEGSGNSSVPHPIAAPEATKRVRFPRLVGLVMAIVTALGLTACSLAPTKQYPLYRLQPYESCR